MDDLAKFVRAERLFRSWEECAARARAEVRRRPGVGHLTNDEFANDEHLMREVNKLHRAYFKAMHSPEDRDFFFDRGRRHGKTKNRSRTRGRLGERGQPVNQKRVRAALRRLSNGEPIDVVYLEWGGRFLAWPRGFNGPLDEEGLSGHRTLESALTSLAEKLSGWPYDPTNDPDLEHYEPLGAVSSSQFRLRPASNLAVFRPSASG